MERLTEWRGEHAAIVNHHANYIDLLAKYEDIGLSPDEIEAQLATYSSVLCDVTNNKMSKTNYTLEAIRYAIQDAQDEDCDRCEYSEYLRRYEEAEESGMLFRLPCKVGQEVFTIEDAAIYCEVDGREEVDHILRFEYGDCGLQFSTEWYESRPVEEIGKTVFFTRKEAEEMLRKGHEWKE